MLLAVGAVYAEDTLEFTATNGDIIIRKGKG
jgi:hypothetical protein